MSAATIEPRTIVWGRTRCASCARRPADGLLDGSPICWPCLLIEVDDWYAHAVTSRRFVYSLDEDLHAEERPSRLPTLPPFPVTVELCPRCRRSEQTVAWLAGQGWPKDCTVCRWCW